MHTLAVNFSSPKRFVTKPFWRESHKKWIKNQKSSSTKGNRKGNSENFNEIHDILLKQTHNKHLVCKKSVLALDGNVSVVTRAANIMIEEAADSESCTEESGVVSGTELLKDGEKRERGKKDAAVQTPQPTETDRILQFPEGSPLAATHEAAATAAHVATMGFQMDDARLIIDGTLWGTPYYLALRDDFRLTAAYGEDTAELRYSIVLSTFAAFIAMLTYALTTSGPTAMLGMSVKSLIAMLGYPKSIPGVFCVWLLGHSAISLVAWAVTKWTGPARLNDTPTSPLVAFYPNNGAIMPPTQ